MREPGSVPRPAVVLLALLLNVPLAALFTGCGGPRENPLDAVHDLRGVPLSDDLQPAVAAALAELAAGGPEPPAARRLRTYQELERRIERLDSRAEAAAEAFAFWRREPTDLLWIQLAISNRHLLDRDAEYDTMFARPELADTSSAVHHYLHALDRYRSADRFDRLDRAAAGLDSLDGLAQAWLVRFLARADADRGTPLAGVRRLLDRLPAARAVGGRRLASLYWQTISALLRRADRLDDALHAAALAAAQAIGVGDGRGEGDGRLLLARVLEARREYGAALAQVERCAADARRHDDPWLAARALSRADAICGATGDLERALGYARRALAVTRAMNDSLNIPRALINVSYNLRLLGRMDSSRTYLDLAGVRLRSSGSPGQRSRFLMYEAQHSCHAGDYAAAESLLVAALGAMPPRALAAEQARILMELVRVGLDLDRAGFVYRTLDRLEELQHAFADVLADQNMNGEYELARAELLTRQGEYRLASEALERARRAIEARGGEGLDWEYQRAAGDLALVRDDLPAARAAYDSCVVLAGERGDPDRMAASRFRLARVLLAEGEAAAAGALFAAAEAQDEPGFGSRFRTRLSSLLLRAMARARAGEHDAALAGYDEIVALGGAHAPPDLLTRLHLERGRSLVATGRPRRAEEALLAARDALRASGGLSFVEELRAYHHAAARELTELLVGLYADHPGLLGGGDPAAHTLILAAELQERHGPGAPAAGALRPADLARTTQPLLCFLVGERRSFRWLVAERGIVLEELPGRDELLESIAPVVVDLARPGRPVGEAAPRRLGELLLERVADAWPPGVLLRIVADDVLAAVPWTCLPVPAADRPVPASALEHGPISHPPSLTVALRAEPARSVAGLSMLAVGHDGTVAADAPGGAPPALRHAESEARRVAGIWSAGAATLATGDLASWERLLGRGLGDYGVIHLATHARARQGLPRRSTLRLASDGDGTPVTAGDLEELDLRAELVYLSCCEAARSLSAGGGGLDSIARAFLRAGARSVVASTQRIDDAAAADLAERFYRHWLAGESKAAALRTALLELRAARPEWRHPYYWASYRLIGDGA